jgi:hypothetical protein
MEFEGMVWNLTVLTKVSYPNSNAVKSILHLYIYIYICMCVCGGGGVGEREREMYNCCCA